MPEEVAATLIEEWRSTRQHTRDIVDEVANDKLDEELPRPGLNTFSRHVHEMVEVQMAYTRVIVGEELDFSDVPSGEEDVYPLDESELLARLEKGNAYFDEVVSETADWSGDVELFGEAVPRWYVLQQMIVHETLHHGQFVAFGYLLDVEFPDGFSRAWALPDAP